MLRYATALRSANPLQRRAAVKELSQMGTALPSAAMTSLIALLEDPDDSVREAATDALINVGNADAPCEGFLGALARMLGDRHDGTRMKVVSIVSRMGLKARPLIPALVESLRNKNLIFCRMAAEALTRMGPDAIMALEPLRDDADPYVQREARWALVRLSGGTSKEDTIHIRRTSGGDHPTVRIPPAATERPSPRSLQCTQQVPVVSTPRLDRRDHTRHRCPRPAFYSFLADVGSGLWWQGEICDVSRTGLGMMISRPATPGAPMTIDLHEVHEGLHRKAVARIAHCHKVGEHWRIGCFLLRPLSAEELGLLVG